VPHPLRHSLRRAGQTGPDAPESGGRATTEIRGAL
jgi:hypothetical protein